MPEWDKDAPQSYWEAVPVLLVAPLLAVSQGAVAPSCGFPNLVGLCTDSSLLLLVIFLLALYYMSVLVFHHRTQSWSLGVSPWITPPNHSDLWITPKTASRSPQRALRGLARWERVPPPVLVASWGL